MDLYDATPDHLPGISGLHVGTADPGETARLLSETNAVLREAGLSIANAAPDAIVVVPGKDGDGLGWRTVVVINGDVIGIIVCQHHIQ